MRAQRSFTCLPVSFSSPPMTFRRIYLFEHFNDDHLLQTDKIISGPHKSDWTCFLVVFVLIRPFKLVICWALRVNCTCTRIDYSTRLGIFIEGRYILPCPPNYGTCSSTWDYRHRLLLDKFMKYPQLRSQFLEATLCAVLNARADVSDRKL